MNEGNGFEHGEDIPRQPELDIVPNRVKHNYGQEYAQARAGDIIEASLRLDLNAEFAPIFAQYFTDLYLIEVERKNPPTDGIMVDFRKLRVGEEMPWSRTLSVDADELSKRINEIRNLLNLDITSTEEVQAKKEATILPLVSRILIDDMDDEMFRPAVGVLIENDSPLLPKNAATQLTPEARNNLSKLMFIAFDWIMFEQSMVVLSESYYMRNTYGKYFPDVNVRRVGRGQFAMSAAYLASRYSKDKAPTVKEDLTNLMQGFGLMMVGNSLMQHDLVENPKRIEWAITQLKNNRPNAFSDEEIAAHFQSLVPKPDVLSGYEELSNLFYDRQLDDELGDEPDLALE